MDIAFPLGFSGIVAGTQNPDKQELVVLFTLVFDRIFMFVMEYSIFRYLIIFLALLYTSCATIHTDAEISSVDQAYDIIQARNYQHAYDILKSQADNNNAYAYFGLAVLHGSESLKNNPHYSPEKELAAYHIAAKAGIAEAQFGYASSLKGKISYRDNPESYKNNYSEACTWYEKSAMQGFGYARIALAWCYEQGRFGGQKDYTKAYMWFALAANRFEVEADPYAPNSMVSVLMRRVAKKGNLTKEQIKQALEMAREIEKNRLAIKSRSLTP